MLKKVLKEYCAPIPEENEEPSPSEYTRPPNASTSIVMVMNTVTDRQPGTLENGQLKPEQEPQVSSRSEDEATRPQSTEPVSPMTRA